MKRPPLVVGVIASPADLRLALAMPQPPDLFELRLDCLAGMLNRLERKMSTRHAVASRRRILRAPLILTARDPREGGANKLSITLRRDLLLRFLPYAKYLDVELRNARAFKPILDRARKRNVRRILSFHDFQSAPSRRTLRAKAAQAKRLGADIFKIACRVDEPKEIARLVDFVLEKQTKLPISAMGIGQLGAASRLLLARCGSVLNYASLNKAQVQGQTSVDILRSAL